jgi:hypothetical protein
VVVGIEIVKEGFIPGDLFESEGPVRLHDLSPVDVATEGILFVIPEAVGEFRSTNDNGAGEDHHQDEMKGRA